MAKKVGNQIDWSFQVKTSNETDVVDTDAKEGIKKVADMLHLIGADALEVVKFKNKEDKVVSTFGLMSLFKAGTAETELVKYIKQQIKDNEDITQIQIIA
jgi:hypothetical protein